MANLLKRTVSGTILAVLTIIFVLKAPENIFKLAVSILATISVWELAKMFKKRLPYINVKDITIMGFITAVSFLFGNIYLSLLLIFLYSFYIAVRIYLLNYLPAVVFILIYGGIAVSSLALLMDIDRNLMLILFATVWSGDIFAYIFGKTLGRIKLAPRLSPKKTVEGALGGAIGSIIIGSMVALYLGYHIALIPIIISSFVMQIGDLFESFIKRQVKVKDSSNLIPGHGGILDRIDALIFANLVFVAFFQLVENIPFDFFNYG
jgi:phosphatidate cytidylyltransferase